ncbi:MAG: DinB family protein [bacterium]
MTYYGATQLAASFRTVRQNTIQIAEEIPDTQYGFIPAEGARSIGDTLAHIAVAPQFQLSLHGGEPCSTFEGFDFMAVIKTMADQEAAERTPSQIVELLKTEGEVCASFLEGVSDDFLAGAFTMPAGSSPASKSRFEMLLSVKEHEMHHRGQLMLAERLIGLVPHLTRARLEYAAAQAPSASS